MQPGCLAVFHGRPPEGTAPYGELPPGMCRISMLDARCAEIASCAIVARSTIQPANLLSQRSPRFSPWRKRKNGMRKAKRRYTSSMEPPRKFTPSPPAGMTTDLVGFGIQRKACRGARTLSHAIEPITDCLADAPEPAMFIGSRITGENRANCAIMSSSVHRADGGLPHEADDRFDT